MPKQLTNYLFFAGGAGVYVSNPGEVVTEKSERKKEFANLSRFEYLMEKLKSPHMNAVGFLPPPVIGEDMGRWGDAFFGLVKIDDQVGFSWTKKKKKQKKKQQTTKQNKKPNRKKKKKKKPTRKKPEDGSEDEN